MVVYIRKPDHCTRCHKAFAGATMIMVREKVAHEIIANEWAIHTFDTVPVCDGCATVKESADATRQKTCQGCGARMLTNPYLPKKDTCCNRCEQRARRARRARARPSRPCAVCKTYFVPKRADAKFCSNACRQWTYRLRQH